MRKRGNLVVDQLGWIILAVVVLGVMVLAYMVINGKLSEAGGFLRDLFRFGG